MSVHQGSLSTDNEMVTATCPSDISRLPPLEMGVAIGRVFAALECMGVLVSRFELSATGGISCVFYRDTVVPLMSETPETENAKIEKWAGWVLSRAIDHAREP